MPNTFAYLALLSWPIVAFLLFRTIKDRSRAIIWSVVASFLLLPSSMAIDLPGIPAMDKVTIPNLTLFLLVAFGSEKDLSILPKSFVGRFLLITLIVSPFFTALANPSPLRFGGTFLQGMTIYDALSSVIQALLKIAPFLVGCACLGRVHSHREMLRILLKAGLFYSVLMLFEIRMSPQLHSWVYGYFPHSFLQQIRDGGFRPVVFLQHGLWIAFFAMTITVSAAVLRRDTQTGSEAALAGASALNALKVVYLGVVLMLCKSLGSLLYAIFLVPVVIFAKPRTQIWIAASLVLISLTYPALRGFGLFPIDAIQEIAQSISEERAASLQTRIGNEEQLLAKASQRPLFGWGSYGRNRIYDPDTGEDLSITDGFWVIIIGTSGWIGYLATFGLLALPVLSVLRRMRKSPEEPSPVTSGLCLLLAINMVEILPNSTLPPWTWLIAGALLGYAESQESASERTATSRMPSGRRRTVI